MSRQIVQPLAAGVPTGGASGQVLTKTTGTSFDAAWQTPAAGGGLTLPLGQNLTFAPDGTWDIGVANTSNRPRWVFATAGVQTNNAFLSSYLETKEIAAPASPGSGSLRLYAKSDHKLYSQDSTGLETLLGGLTLPLGQNLTFSPDNTYDIGATAASRPRDVYVGRNLYGVTLGGSTSVVTPFVTSNSGVLSLGSNQTSRWQVSGSGHLWAAADNTYDIGASGGSRPRNLYLAGSISIGADATPPIIRTWPGNSQGLMIQSPGLAVIADGKSGAQLAGNAYFDGTNWNRYDVAQPACLLGVGQGYMNVSTAPAGANPVTWTQRMQVDSAGALTLPPASVTTPMLAPNAATQQGQGNFDGSTYTRTTPINSATVMPGVTSITLTTTGGPVLLLGTALWNHSAAGATASFGFAVDGAPSLICQTMEPVAGYWQNSAWHYIFTNVSAGSHTFQLVWDNNSAGTLTRGPWYGNIQAVELKR